MAADELSVQELSDEDLAKLIELGVIPEKQAMLAKQMQQAQMLQQRKMPQGRQAGNVYVAPNPLEFVGAVGQAFKGQRQEKDLQAKLDDLQKQQLMARQLYAMRATDSPYRRSTQPFIQQQQVDPNNVPMPGMNF